jgi:hypothetical protein
MKRIVVHGVRVTVCTPEEASELGLAFALTLSDGRGVVRLTTAELLQVAGYETDKIDAAVPLHFTHRRTVTGSVEQIHDPHDYVWSYEDSSIFGKPVKLETARRRAVLEITRVLDESIG